MHYKLLLWLPHARFVLTPQLGPGEVELLEPELGIRAPTLDT